MLEKAKSELWKKKGSLYRISFKSSKISLKNRKRFKISSRLKRKKWMNRINVYRTYWLKLVKRLIKISNIY
jgi:hypothetical protein